MKLYIKYLIYITLSFNIYNVQAQIFPGEQNPPSLKWRQISTENFQIIYPESFSSQAQRMANVLEHVIEKVAGSLNKKPRKISIILQNQGTTSNGFVQLAPRRSEFFTTPSQAFDYQNWLNSLAVHELRHVVQFDKLTGWFNRPPFETLALAMFGVSLPSWFFEGDAVTTETVLTKGGRGRIPEWYINFRSNTLSGKKFSYSKDYFGSVKDYTPGYYQLGFFMNTKARRDYGNSINDRILTRISTRPFMPYNFSTALKKFTGLSSRNLHDSTVYEMRKIWTEQMNRNGFENYQPLNPRSTSTPQDFLLPVTSGRGSVFFLLNSKAETPAIYVLKDGQAEKLIDIGAQEIPWFSYAADKVVWDEFRFDARYHQRSFNVINIYDLVSKRRKQLTHKSRYFAPALSPDGSSIFVVEVSTSQLISIVELSSDDGQEKRRYPAPENFMLQMPKVHPHGKKIIMVGVANSGKTLLELDCQTGKFKQLFPLQFQEILKPEYAEDQVLFKAHYNGVDNIYRFDPKDEQIYQVTSSKFGAQYPSYDPVSKKIMFSNHSPEGYDITSTPLRNHLGTNINSLPTQVSTYAQPLIPDETNGSIVETIPERKYPNKPYHELANLFYFHTLQPTIEDNGYFEDSNYGLRLQSDNKLNTLSFHTRYRFNNALRKSEYQAGLTYSRFFPKVEFSYLNQARQITRRTTVQGQPVSIPISWREHEYVAEISIPLYFNQFNSNYSLGFKAGSSYTQRYDIENNFPGLLSSIRFPMRYEFTATRNSRRSARDLAPRWGQNLTIRYRHSPFENRIDGELFTFRSTFYFPGLLKNHSLQASINFQTNSGQYQNTIDIPRPSGYSFMKSGLNTANSLLLDYRFPLFYPDWELGPLAYIKRLKVGLFADYSNLDTRQQWSPESFGAELRADMNLLRFTLPNFDLGGRLIFLNENLNQTPIFETVVGYNF